MIVLASKKHLSDICQASDQTIHQTQSILAPFRLFLDTAPGNKPLMLPLLELLAEFGSKLTATPQPKRKKVVFNITLQDDGIYFVLPTQVLLRRAALEFIRNQMRDDPPPVEWEPSSTWPWERRYPHLIRMRQFQTYTALRDFMATLKAGDTLYYCGTVNYQPCKPTRIDVKGIRVDKEARVHLLVPGVFEGSILEMHVCSDLQNCLGKGLFTTEAAAQAYYEEANRCFLNDADWLRFVEEERISMEAERYDDLHRYDYEDRFAYNDDDYGPFVRNAP